jgi:hypothetical protein
MAAVHLASERDSGDELDLAVAAPSAVSLLSWGGLARLANLQRRMPSQAKVSKKRKPARKPRRARELPTFTSVFKVGVKNPR